MLTTRDEAERRARADARRRHPAGKARVTPPAYGRTMDEPSTHPATGEARGTGPAADPEQQPLPFGCLPYDDEADHPIPFSLTARARLEVAPHAVPSLRVIRDDPAGVRPDPGADTGELEEPGDTRPARARALRRSGLAIEAIADQLDADELAVRAWVGDVVVHPRARDAVRRERGPVAEPARPRSDEQRTAFELARAAARDEVIGRLETDAPFAAGLGLAAALVEIDLHAVTARTTQVEVAARLLGWLREQLEVEAGRTRVVLRLGDDVAGDLARHRWASELGLPVEQVSHTRWRGAPTPDTVEALVRIADPIAAATLAGWRDALLLPADGRGPADVAF